MGIITGDTCGITKGISVPLGGRITHLTNHAGISPLGVADQALTCPCGHLRSIVFFVPCEIGYDQTGW